MKRKTLVAGSTILTTAFIMGCGAKEPPHGDTADLRDLTADISVVRLVDSPTILEVSGTVSAQFNATLSSKIMARVAGITVNEGDHVRKGQHLISLDAADLSAAERMAAANLTSAEVGYSAAKTSLSMEEKVSRTKVDQAEALVRQSQASVRAAKAKLDLARSGPRIQEKAQANLAVQEASSALALAESQLRRVEHLYQQGAMSKRELEVAQNAYETAKARYQIAVQTKDIAEEGTRREDIRAAEEMVRQSEGALRQAEAGLAQAKAAILTVEVRRAEMKSARAQITQSAAARQVAAVSVGYASISAPFDGIVVTRLADPGSMAAPGVPLVQVEGGKLRLMATLPEKVMSKIKKGATIPVILDALEGKAIEAKVAEITPKGSAQTHSFIVKLDLPPNRRVLSGMFGRALFEVGHERKLVVPSSAIFEREGLHYVYALEENNIAQLRFVTTGRTMGSQVEVLSGLEQGDRVVSSNVKQIVDGIKVVGR